MDSVAIVILVAAWVVLCFVIWAARYTKVGPNEVLIVSGRKRKVVGPDGTKQVVGYRLVRGGGTFVMPIKEKAQRLSLEVMTLELKTPKVYTAPGVPVMVDGVAQIKVKSDETSIGVAAEQFLSRSREAMMQVALQVVDGDMRAILGTMTIEEIYTNREGLAKRIREAASPDLARMGLEIISLTIRNIADEEGYLEALGKPRIAQVKRAAIVGEAEAEREAQTARFMAQIKIEEARKALEMKKAEYEAEIQEKRAKADLAYDLQKHKLSKAVKKEEVEVEIVGREKLIELQEKEVLRREKELEATIKKEAEAEAYRMKVLAEGEKYKRQVESLGEAEAVRAKGYAEAEVLRAKGASEAEAMELKAKSWGEYNEAAITERFLDILPKLAQAVSEPLSKTEKIVIVNSGGAANGSTGASKVTRDVAEIIAQLPTVIQSLTGVNLQNLLSRIPGLKAAAPDGKIVGERPQPAEVSGPGS